MRLYALLERSAAAALTQQDAKSGSFAPGHNGPYRDTETPVRNTGHWLVTFARVYALCGDRRFRDAAWGAASFLRSPAARPCGAAFWHRASPQKDACNGLVGQAWSIEALVAAAELFEAPDLARMAETVFLLHPFDPDLGLWWRVGLDGSGRACDLTFNHQLWFAAAGGLLAPHASHEVSARVGRFLDRLEESFSLHRSGLIRHPLTARAVWRRQPRYAVRALRVGRRQRAALAHKALGYHAFNLYAFALLRTRYPDHRFWKSARWRRALRYATTPGFRSGLDRNEFGYPYNPAGLEMAFALGVFEVGTRTEREGWLGEQFRRCFDFPRDSLSRATSDSLTLAARLYEATRLEDLRVPVGDTPGSRPPPPRSR